MSFVRELYSRWRLRALLITFHGVWSTILTGIFYFLFLNVAIYLITSSSPSFSTTLEQKSRCSSTSLRGRTVQLIFEAVAVISRLAPELFIDSSLTWEKMKFSTVIYRGWRRPALVLMPFASMDGKGCEMVEWMYPRATIRNDDPRNVDEVNNETTGNGIQISDPIIFMTQFTVPRFSFQFPVHSSRVHVCSVLDSLFRPEMLRCLPVEVTDDWSWHLKVKLNELLEWIIIITFW